MKIIVVGAGTVGSAICEQLVKEGHDVTVVDNHESSVAQISASYDVTAVMGSSADIDVLCQAGAKTADMLIAVTPMDELNMLCCYAAKKLGTLYTAARVRNPEYSTFMDLMKADMNLSMTINPEYAVAKKISRILKFHTASKVDWPEAPVPKSHRSCRPNFSMAAAGVRCLAVGSIRLTKGSTRLS